MDIDDDTPRHQKPLPKDLEVMSIEALHEYIEELEAEIARTRTAITKKEGGRAAAESVFKK